jgi:hypothetical protein
MITIIFLRLWNLTEFGCGLMYGILSINNGFNKGSIDVSEITLTSETA